MSDPWPGMRVEAASPDEVRTTGSIWRRGGDGTMDVRQRIGARRPLLRLHGMTDDVARTVRDDSVLVVRARAPVTIRVEPLFAPVHVARHRGRFMVLDEHGGYGVYPLRPRLVTRTDVLRLGAGEEAWIAAFPPRERSPVRASQRVAHEGRPAPFPEGAYPSADIVADAARHCGVFCLHAYFWKAAAAADRPRLGRYAGRRCSWRTRRHEPHDAARLAALRDAVRAAGMEFVVYLSPEHCRAPDIESEMSRVLDEYGVDGLYLDGVANDLASLDHVVRRARQILGPRRILYLNATNQPFGTPRVYAPFVDAQCDFVLRGDSGRGGLARDAFLRFAVSGRGISNAEGLWCHYGSAGRPVLRERMPGADDVRAAHAVGAHLWRRSQAWREAGDDPALFDRWSVAAPRCRD